ncbi:MAG: hypothetical protein B6D55_06345 [Candidatus Omnitrophica bacterium 4484_70.2]|nr:MAG: hypothetical protein B6D55_06345 [Candidatus Omnitrophica bacterium 4484_70.2]
MSVRAYRIKRIEHEDFPSFNIWHHKKLVEYLERNSNFFSTLNEDSVGIAEVEVEILVKALEDPEVISSTPEYVLDQIREDIKEAWRKNEDYILYYCF